MEYKKLQNLSFEDLGKGKSEYKQLMDKEPFKEGLEEIEVIEDGLPKKVLITKLSYIYSLLDSIYQNYDIEQKQILQVGKAIVVVVRIWTVGHDGVERFRDGSGMVDASQGVKHGTARAETLAIKNAAKKFGRIFGRDLYANREDEKGEKPNSIEEPEEIDVTSPRGRIIVQARKSKTKAGIQKVFETAKSLLNEGEIEADDLQVFEEIQKATERIEKK